LMKRLSPDSASSVICSIGRDEAMPTSSRLALRTNPDTPEVLEASSRAVLILAIRTSILNTLLTGGVTLGQGTVNRSSKMYRSVPV
jgi:hypothetical protein